MDNKLIIRSLALDLKRIVQGKIIGSDKMVDRFTLEALRWRREVDTSTLSDRIKKLLTKIEEVLRKKDSKRLADDALLYSNLLLHFSK